MNLVVIIGQITWAVRPSTDDQGNPILIATSDVFRSVLWGETQDDLTDKMTRAVKLLLTYFLERDRRDVLESMGFVVRYEARAPSPVGGIAGLELVNGTTHHHILQPAVA